MAFSVFDEEPVPIPESRRASEWIREGYEKDAEELKRRKEEALLLALMKATGSPGNCGHDREHAAPFVICGCPPADYVLVPRWMVDASAKMALANLKSKRINKTGAFAKLSARVASDAKDFHTFRLFEMAKSSGALQDGYRATSGADTESIKNTIGKLVRRVRRGRKADPGRYRRAENLSAIMELPWESHFAPDFVDLLTNRIVPSTT